MNAEMDELPEGWAWSKLGELSSPSSNKVEPKETPNVRYLSLEHIEPHTGRILGHGRGADVNSTKAIFRSGDVLYGKLRPYLNKVTVPDFDGICSTDILVFNQKPWIDSRFLMRFLFSTAVVDFANHNSSGVQLPRIAWGQLSTIDVPLPPLTEQRRIVAKVEEVLSRVNAARERLAKVPAILKRFRQAVLAAACSGRLTADWRIDNQAVESVSTLIAKIFEDRNRRFEGTVQQARDRDAKAPGKPANLNRQKANGDDLPDLPDSWEWVTWNDLADWITYGFTRPMPHVAQGIPIVSAKNVRDGHIEFRDVELTTPEAFAALSEKDKPRRGEILITKDGAIRGRAALVETDERFCITQAVAVVRFGGLSGDPAYLLFSIQSPFTQHLIEEESSGTAIPHISITSFGRFPVAFPPLSEQREIVRRAEALFRLADAIEGRLATATARVEKLTQAVLAKAFRGELVPTEAELARVEGRDYEPASVLLERVRASRASVDPVKKSCGSHKNPSPSSATQPI